MTPRPSELALLAERSARAVGPDLLEAFKNPGPVEYKRNFHDPVTVHDRRAEAAIRAILFEALPSSLLLGEEEGHVIDSSGSRTVPGPNDVVWLVDPIDGTSNFTSGLLFWCVSIAAVVGGEVVAGVIYQPSLDVLYLADDTGAYRNGEPMRVSDQPPHRSLFAADFPSERIEDQDGAARGYQLLLEGSKSMRRLGSTALHLAGVAEGTLGACLGMGTQPWDIGAGIALVKAAGGQILGVRDDRSTNTSVYDSPTYAAAGHPDSLQLCLDAIGCVAPQDLQTHYFGGDA
ncbi:inositol monophosphatase [Trueperella bernardiae]|uniref:inositol monophosphatase family protein n=1 Tax=Trueperella bernardiae TaxID=59561 RepID=UPI000C7C50B1|nr:inositol monophosphatase family protein [Trueperella bernardiae]PKZ88895.1 inositol monophosphatase [Trueperella bernardiae]